jgi:hypothetical protein
VKSDDRTTKGRGCKRAEPIESFVRFFADVDDVAGGCCEDRRIGMIRSGKKEGGLDGPRISQTEIVINGEREVTDSLISDNTETMRRNLSRIGKTVSGDQDGSECFEKDLFHIDQLQKNFTSSPALSAATFRRFEFETEIAPKVSPAFSWIPSLTPEALVTVDPPM